MKKCFILLICTLLIGCGFKLNSKASNTTQDIQVAGDPNESILTLNNHIQDSGIKVNKTSIYKLEILKESWSRDNISSSSTYLENINISLAIHWQLKKHDSVVLKETTRISQLITNNNSNQTDNFDIEQHNIENLRDNVATLITIRLLTFIGS